MEQEYLDVYTRYLKKFTELFGEVDFEQTVQNRGRLVIKLKYDEFVKKWEEFKQVEDYLKDVMTKGYTLNDEVNRQYGELCAAVLENPKDFMLL